MSEPVTKYTTQYMQNMGFDDVYLEPTVEILGEDRVNHVLRRIQVGPDGGLFDSAMALKETIVGAISYWGVAAPGSAQSSAVWQAFKIDESSGLVLTYADGNANFDNVATDLTALSYS